MPSPDSDPDYDLAIVGAGVVGAGIARALSEHSVRCVVLDAAVDVGTGTSRANTAIHHTGFDAKPGSLEAALLRRSYPLTRAYAAAAGIPLEATGAALVAWNDDQLSRLPDLEATARANGCVDVKRIGPSELYEEEPDLGPGARGALIVPGEGILCTFTLPLALATHAQANGVDFKFGHQVVDVQTRQTDHGVVHALETPAGVVTASWVINAAGLRSDEIDRLFGHESFVVSPRRGQLIIFDKLSRPLLGHVLLPVPTATSKGVLVSPTVYGNLVLGPTAENDVSKTATGTTEDGIDQLIRAGRTILPALDDYEITATYAGLRAATQHSDYQIRCETDQHYICVGGIRSTGVSASLGIAEYVVDLLRSAGFALGTRRQTRAPHMPTIGESSRRPYQDDEAIASNPAYGSIVCHCERVTRGEIEDAARSPLPPRDLDGLRRRTRAMMGRCQGFYCSATVMKLFEESALVPAGVDPQRSQDVTPW